MYFCKYLFVYVFCKLISLSKLEKDNFIKNTDITCNIEFFYAYTHIHLCLFLYNSVSVKYYKYILLYNIYICFY